MDPNHYIDNDINLRNLHVYILKNDRYFGYQKIGDKTTLREYMLQDVAKSVEDAFSGSDKVFLDSTINPNTSLMVVPDNWNGVLPDAANQYLPNIETIEFVYFLHPGILAEQLKIARAPFDAALQIEVQKIRASKLANDTAKIRPLAASPAQFQNLLARYGGALSPNSLTLRAPAPDMMAETPTRRRSLSRKSSASDLMIQSQASVQPQLARSRSKSVTRSAQNKPSWKGQMDSMATMSYDDAQKTLGLAPGELADYKKAWTAIRDRA